MSLQVFVISGSKIKLLSSSSQRVKELVYGEQKTGVLWTRNPKLRYQNAASTVAAMRARKDNWCYSTFCNFSFPWPKLTELWGSPTLSVAFHFLLWQWIRLTPWVRTHGRGRRHPKIHPSLGRTRTCGPPTLPATNININDASCTLISDSTCARSQVQTHTSISRISQNRRVNPWPHLSKQDLGQIWQERPAVHTACLTSSRTMLTLANSPNTNTQPCSPHWLQF